MAAASPEPRPFEPGHLERWIEAFRGPLVGLLASWGNDWAVAEELAADAFAEAWVGRGRFRGDAEDLGLVGAWLRGIAFHLWRARVRREEGRRMEPLGEEPVAAAGEGDGRRELLERALARLPAAQRTILCMHYLEESGVKEVAALLGLSEKAVEGRLHHARKALRALVEREARAVDRGARR